MLHGSLGGVRTIGMERLVSVEPRPVVRILDAVLFLVRWTGNH